MNARFDDEDGVVSRHHAVHLGIATQTAKGLMVPVVQHAEAQRPVGLRRRGRPAGRSGARTARSRSTN